MFSASAELYDTIYGAFKDYRAEAAAIATLLHGMDPRYKTVLDVACGTGEHARYLSELGFQVDGLDLDPALVRIARTKHPAGKFFEADMSAFDLAQSYDVVMCLFSSIGYLQTLDRVNRAFDCFRRHVAPGGAILLEPWFEPGVLEHGRVTRNLGKSESLRVVRTGRMEVEQRLSRLHFDYEITDHTGTRHASEVHELGLFTAGELLESFRAAGLEASYDSKGLTGRGLYVARVA